MESGFGLPYDFAGLHELLRNAHGRTFAGYGTSKLRGHDSKERKAPGADWDVSTSIEMPFPS